MDTCKICKSSVEKIFSKQILKKYNADYFKCTNCDFVQTSEPVWLEEAYSSAITSLDIGLLNRNLRMLDVIPKIIDSCFPDAKIMLDYAGGYGVFTRFMRDQGYDFYRQDIYCENLFTKYFDITDIKNTKFDVVTAFEVFEHFADPLPEIEKLFAYSDNFIISTILIPGSIQELENWWYLSVETGQHVAFYSSKTMQYLAKKYNKNYYAKGESLHVFTSRTLNQDQVDYALNDKTYKSLLFGLYKKPFNYKIRRDSLIEKDYQYIKKLLK